MTANDPKDRLTRFTQPEKATPQTIDAAILAMTDALGYNHCRVVVTPPWIDGQHEDEYQAFVYGRGPGARDAGSHFFVTGRREVGDEIRPRHHLAENVLAHLCEQIAPLAAARDNAERALAPLRRKFDEQSHHNKETP